MLKRIAVLCTGWVYGLAAICIGRLSYSCTELFRWATYKVKVISDWLLAPFTPTNHLDTNDIREPIATISAPGARTCRTANLSERDRAGLSLGAEQHRMSLCM